MQKVKSIIKLTLSSLFSLSLIGCSLMSDEKVERIPDRSPQAQYQEAKAQLNDGMYSRAITLLTELEARYPFGPLSRQIQLDLMFAYYKSGNFEQALPEIERFTRLNPNHPQADYVLFLKGLINMEVGLNAFQDFFGMENADKDIEAARESFINFSTLVKSYPESKYNPEAKKHMVVLLNKLARHEIVIAQYYMRRDAYVAALNRCKYVLEYYQHSDSLKPALQIMVQAYGHLGLNQMKSDTEKTLALNFPD